MIFVTVGTHEQPFNRLVAAIDELKRKGIIQEEIVIQTGFSTYKPETCYWQKLFPYEDMVRYVSKARIVITHGGPSSFIMPLQIGKVPVVVPRQKKFNEHVNDHQVEFVRAVAERQGNILVVEDIEEMGKVIGNYAEMVGDLKTEIKSNNQVFLEHFEKMVTEIFDGRNS